MTYTKTEPLKPVLVNLYCEKCDGLMKSTGRCFYTAPLKFEMQCDYCDTVLTANKSYPYVDFEDENGNLILECV